RAVEPDCRELVAGAIKRGKVDCTLKLSAAEQAATSTRVAAASLEALRSLEARVRDVFPAAEPLTTYEVLRWPGVLEEPAQSLEELAEPIQRCLAAALKALQDAR